MTPMSSHACWSAGGRNAPAVANRRRPPPNWVWTLRNRSRRTAYGMRRAMPRSRLNVAVRPCFSTSRSIALQNRSSTWGTRTMLVTRCSRRRVEDDPRVAAADVQDVGADVERVVQRDGLLERVRQREQRHDPVLHRVDDPVERHGSGEHVGVGQDHALGVAGRARREHELEDVGGLRAGPRRPAAPPSRAGRCRPGRPTGPRRSRWGTARARPRAGRGRRGRCRAGGGRRPTCRRSGRRCPGPCGRRAGRTRAPRTSRRSTRRGARASTATRSAPDRPASSPSALSRQAAIRLRRTTSAYVQCHVDPSSMRSPSACFGPNRAAASSSRSTMVSMVG